MNQRIPRLDAADSGDSPVPPAVPSAYAINVQDGQLHAAYQGTLVEDWSWIILPSQVPRDRPTDDVMLGFTCNMARTDDHHWRVQVQAHFRDGGDLPGTAVVLLIHRAAT